MVGRLRLNAILSTDRSAKHFVISLNGLERLQVILVRPWECDNPLLCVGLDPLNTWSRLWSSFEFNVDVRICCLRHQIPTSALFDTVNFVVATYRSDTFRPILCVAGLSVIVSPLT